MTRPQSSTGRGRRLGALGAVIGVAALLVLVGGIATAVVRLSGSEATTAGVDAPRAAVDAYYAALQRKDAAAAFSLLCSVQQQSGEPSFGDLVRRNDATGTGIAQWRSTPSTTSGADVAQVPGTLTLGDGTVNPLTVALLRERGAWRVCNSDLGGVIPGPGPTTGTRT